MKLEAVRVKGFRSFSSEQVLDLSTLPPGLYFVTGENLENPELGANAVGKSSLFEAPHWALFGTTSRGLKAGNVNAWSSPKGGCEVALVLEGQVVERGWKPNYLRLDGEELTQEALLTALGGLNEAVALHTYFFCQTSEFFLDLKPPQRMDIYADVLGLRLWEEKADKARDYARQQTTEIASIEVSIAENKARAAALRENKLETEIKKWDKEHAATVREVEARIEEDKQIAKTEQERREEWQKEIARLKKAKEKAGAKVNEEVKKIRNLEAAKENDAALVRLLQQRISKAEEMEEGTCFFCGNPVTAKHKQEHLRTLRQQLKAARSVAYVSAVALEAFEKEAKAVVAELKKLEAALVDTEVEERTLARSISAQAAETLAAEKTLKKLKSNANPFLQQSQKNEARAKECDEAVAEDEAKLKEARALETALQFWTKGFKDIRYQVLQESLMQLNAEVNECLHEIGLQEWKLQFEVEKETKSGSVKRGFLCNVLAPSSPEGVPWEAWSGGETQRLRLAAQMGVSNMIRSRTGVSLDVEFWDEPTGWLNEAGIKDVLAILQERAARYDRRIFLADHRSLDFEFDGTINITKTEKGSELSASWLP